MTHSFSRPKHFFAGLIAAAGCLAVMVAAPSRAAEIETQSMEVSTHGLDLTTPQGEARLRHRVALAAQKVCGEAERGDFQASRDVRDCRDVAMLTSEAKIRTVVAHAHQRGVYASSTAHTDQAVR